MFTNVRGAENDRSVDFALEPGTSKFVIVIIFVENLSHTNKSGNKISEIKKTHLEIIFFITNLLNFLNVNRLASTKTNATKCQFCLTYNLHRIQKNPIPNIQIIMKKDF